MYKDDRTWRVSEGTSLDLSSMKVWPVNNGLLPIDIMVSEDSADYYTKSGKSKDYTHHSAQTDVKLRVWLDREHDQWRMGEIARIK